MSTPCRILIVDDEPPARSSIRQLLRRESDVEIVGEAADGRSAADMIRTLRPDVVFLDVQMPELSGVDLVGSLAPAERPVVIFTTAYNTYALEAFALQAVDYLMKPYKDARFYEALARARNRLRHRDVVQLAGEIDRVLSALPPGASDGASASEARHPRLVIKVSGDYTFLPLEEIRWIEGHGDYLKVHCRNGTAPLIRDTFKELQQRLDPQRFVRVHKSIMVNTDYVRRMRTANSGDYEVDLDDGTRLRVSRLYKAGLGAFL